MNVIIGFFVGGLAGWMTGIMMGTNRRNGLLVNIIVGVVGAFLAGIVLPSYFGISQNSFSFLTVMVPLLGAIVLLAVVSLFNRRGGFRLR